MPDTPRHDLVGCISGPGADGGLRPRAATRRVPGQPTHPAAGPWYAWLPAGRTRRNAAGTRHPGVGERRDAHRPRHEGTRRTRAFRCSAAAEPPAGRPGRTVQVAAIDTGIAAATRADGWLTGLVRPDKADPPDELPPPSDGLLAFGAGQRTLAGEGITTLGARRAAAPRHSSRPASPRPRSGRRTPGRTAPSAST